MFSSDKDDYVGLSIVKITIKTDQMLFTSIKVSKIQKPCLSLSLAFFIILLVGKFAPSRQTWYLKGIGTYLFLILFKQLYSDVTTC